MIEAFRLGAVCREGTLWDGLDMAIDDGEACVVTGPPACGKTVLLRILRGERRPDTGDVLVGGGSLFRGEPGARRAFRASLGVVPESFLPSTAGKIRDLFRLSGALGSGVAGREREEREEELLSMVGMAGAREWELPSLSVSEKARVFLAAELFRGPRYLFADMLLSNAGTEWADMLGALFRALAREGKTAVLAERTFPERWRGRWGGEGLVYGPFRVFRLAAGEAPR